MFFGGSADAPLLVQLNDTDEAAGRGPAAGASGAAAAPHLGYVVRRTPSSEMSQEEREAAAADTALYDAAAKKAAAAWKTGFTRALPVPPPGLQWSLGAERGEEEAAERLCELTATYDESGVPGPSQSAARRCPRSTRAPSSRRARRRRWSSRSAAAAAAARRAQSRR